MVLCCRFQPSASWVVFTGCCLRVAAHWCRGLLAPGLPWAIGCFLHLTWKPLRRLGASCQWVSCPLCSLWLWGPLVTVQCLDCLVPVGRMPHASVVGWGLSHELLVLPDEPEYPQPGELTFLLLGCHLGSLLRALRLPYIAGCLPTPAWPFWGWTSLPAAATHYDALSSPSRCPECAVSPFLYSSRRSHFAFVFLTGSCDRRQIMSTKALETKKKRVKCVLVHETSQCIKCIFLALHGSGARGRCPMIVLQIMSYI